jgi:hypothetical protein
MWEELSSEESLETDFPGLVGTRYERASPISFNCNCFGFAIGRNEWWESGVNWPSGVPDDTVEGWVTVLRQQGYSKCDDGMLADAFEKVAVYSQGIEATHVAHQLETGQWESKLGWGIDIKHETLAALEGDNYGNVAVFLQRLRAERSQ